MSLPEYVHRLQLILLATMNRFVAARELQHAQEMQCLLQQMQDAQSLLLAVSGGQEGVPLPTAEHKTADPAPPWRWTGRHATMDRARLLVSPAE